MSRIVVTGGGGRLGRSLVTGLHSAGHQVISFDRIIVDSADFDGVEQVVLDLTDETATRAALLDARADAVVHLAAIAVPFSAPEDVILRTNTQLAHSVLAGAVDVGIERIIAASSPTVLGYGSPNGWMPERLPLDEDVTPHPWNAYALSKLIIEQTMAMLRRRSPASTRFATFRPCFVIAPEEWLGAPTQQGHTVRERLADPALSAPAVFNYVDARDVARFVDRLIEAMPDIPNGETFFVSADDALAVRPLADLFPEYFPGTELVAADLTAQAPAFSNAKARLLLGWRPRHSWRSELPDADLSSLLENQKAQS